MKPITIVLLATTVGILGGCQSGKDPQRVRYDEFPANYSQGQSVKAACDAQAAVGNRQDGTLRASHFDGAQLNSLGEAKIESMLKSGRSDSHLTLYVDLPDDQTRSTIKNSLKTYLKSLNLNESQLTLKDGPNPSAGSGMSARGLAAIEEMRTPTAAMADTGKSSAK